MFNLYKVPHNNYINDKMSIDVLVKVTKDTKDNESYFNMAVVALLIELF